MNDHEEKQWEQTIGKIVNKLPHYTWQQIRFHFLDDDTVYCRNKPIHLAELTIPTDEDADRKFDLQFNSDKNDLVKHVNSDFKLRWSWNQEERLKKICKQITDLGFYVEIENKSFSFPAYIFGVKQEYGSSTQELLYSDILLKDYYLYGRDLHRVDVINLFDYKILIDYEKIKKTKLWEYIQYKPSDVVEEDRNSLEKSDID